jgi:hypothetical protein
VKGLNNKREGLLSCPGIEYMVSVVAKINKKIQKIDPDLSPVTLTTTGKVVMVSFKDMPIWSNLEREQQGRCVDWHNEEYIDLEKFIKAEICEYLHLTNKVNKVIIGYLEKK